MLELGQKHLTVYRDIGYDEVNLTIYKDKFCN